MKEVKLERMILVFLFCSLLRSFLNLLSSNSITFPQNPKNNTLSPDKNGSNNPNNEMGNMTIKTANTKMLLAYNFDQ